MKQKRRSFLKRVISALLTPLGLVGVVKLSDKDSPIEGVLEFANTLEEQQGVVCITDDRGRRWKAWKRNKVYTGYVVDEKGCKWATYEPGATYLRRV